MSQQNWDADRYARTAGYVSQLGAPLIELLAPKPGERILDLGCGEGALTEKIAASGATVVGIDGSKLEFRYYPTIAEYSGKLERHGFAVDYIELFPRPTPMPTGLAGWLDNFGDVFLNAVPPTERESLKRDIESEAATDLRQPDGSWIVDYVRLRFKAHLA